MCDQEHHFAVKLPALNLMETVHVQKGTCGLQLIMLEEIALYICFYERICYVFLIHIIFILLHDIVAVIGHISPNV